MGAPQIAAPRASERVGPAWHLRRRGTDEVVEEFLGRPVAERLMGSDRVVYALPRPPLLAEGGRRPFELGHFVEVRGGRAGGALAAPVRLGECGGTTRLRRPLSFDR